MEDRAVKRLKQNSDTAAGLAEKDILRKKDDLADMDALHDRNQFMEIIHSLKETVETSDRPLTEQEIAAYFKDIGLSGEQQKLIYDYLYDLMEQKAGSENLTKEDGSAAEMDGTADTDISGRAAWKGQSIIKLAEDSKKEPEEAMKLPESVFFKLYLNDIHKIVPCTEQEEEKLYIQLIRGEKAAVQKLSEQWMLRTLELAKKYTVHTEHLPDVIQEGNMAVFLALSNMLGSETRTDFRRALEKAAADAMEAYEKDAAAAEDMDHSLLAKAALVYEAQKFLAESLQRMPSAAELSQYTKLKETELEDILSLLKEKK